MKLVSTIQNRLRATCFSAVLIFSLMGHAQQLHQSQTSLFFNHLNTSNGLSYIGINDMCIDKKENLWISTGNGLNMFNGKTVEKYYVSEYPQLQNNNVAHVTCDSMNRIWVLTSGGNVSMLDDKRQLHRVGLYDKDGFIKTRWILNSQHGGIILFTEKGNFSFNENAALPQKDSLSSKHFLSLSIQGFDTLKAKIYRQVFYYDDNNYLFSQEDAFFKVNFQTKAVEKKYSIPHRTLLAKWENNGLLVFNRSNSQVEVINLTTQDTLALFKDLRDQFGNPITATFNFAEKINTEQYVFTTTNSGIFIYDTRTKQIFNYTHNIADPATVGNTTTSSIAVSSKGWVFITCNPNGISYFNNTDIIGNQPVFLDTQGNGYDGYIAGIATKDNNTYYFGTQSGMLEWKRNTNSTTFLDYPGENGKSIFNRQEVTSIVIDNNDKIWATTSTQGLIVLDKNKQLVKHFKGNCRDKGCIKLQAIANLMLGPDGYIWACGRSGIARINRLTYEVDNFDNTPLSQFDTKFISPILFTDKNNLWIATANSGVFHYNLETKKTDVYNTENGLISNGIFCINADSAKNIYIGTRMGLNILFTNGKIKTITEKDGLLISRAEGLLLDKQNRMWIGNDIGLACYNIKDSSLVTFDQRHGLSIYGFRVNSYYQNSDGEFIFGTPRGLQYFYPDDLFTKKVTLNALISKIETRAIVSSITQNATFNLASFDNQVTFYFSAVDYTPHLRTYYQYMLEGVDKEWVKVADQNSVRYTSLPAGTYTFKVKASSDGKKWESAENSVVIVIAKKIWQQNWFRILGILFGIFLIFYVANYYRNKQIRKRAELETELVITYFASQINRHQKTEDLLWDVAQNCISKLHFEDCVIYLKDEERNILVQKAAYGPKSPVDFTIHKPIEIAVGQGIVGSVALTGKPELVGNTETDGRYIVDDEKRFSEIAVPIIIDGNVVGVIDSENPGKNFFTPKHLRILSTVAVLCASQMQRTKAEKEKQKATLELLENKQRATESRLQSLRLQMNPHFLFNALNSIQQMILANEELVATRYLSRFSKLLRTILIHSDKETITLKEEIEILRMYIELESVRFKESFSYVINCDESIEAEEVKIPTLLIQPFVENAIWHGLMHKENNRELLIEFTEKDDFIQCIVQDNGIGRKKATELKIQTGQDKKHKSKGIEVSAERLKTLKNSSGMSGSISIIDLEDSNGNATGTRVEINFPV